MPNAHPSLAQRINILNQRGSSLVEVLVVTLILMLSVGMFSDVWLRNLTSIDIYQAESELWDESEFIIRVIIENVRAAAYVQVSDVGDRFSFYGQSGKLLGVVFFQPEGKLLLQTGTQELVLSRAVDSRRSRFIKKGNGVETLILLQTKVLANELVEVPVHVEVYPRI